MALKSKFLLLSLLFTLISFSGVSQKILNGYIYTRDSVELSDCILKVKKVHESAFLHFASLAQTNKFSIPLDKLDNVDSIELIISKQGFSTLTSQIDLFSLDHQKPMQFYLSPEVKELKEILIKPSYWKKGDTTFYMVDSFRTGEENKLKDIIEKLPGFSYSNETLRYKGKAVTKILIDNKDLFADRTNLLLESFPAYVLSQIEAIENQPVNRLLKGLSSETETIINLKLNKEKFKVAFGDADIGVASNQRFEMNPTMFLLSKKINFAYVGFNNNMGTILNSLYQNPSNKLALANNKLQPAGIKTINNFNKSSYLNARLFNNQLTTEYGIGKKIKAKTEFLIANEKTTQNNFAKLLLLDTSIIFSRDEMQNLTNKETLIDYKQNFSINLSESKTFKLSYEFQLNKNKNNNLNEIIQNSIKDSVNTIQNENTNLHLIHLDFTQRVSENKALVTTLSFTIHQNTSNRNINANFLPAFYGFNNSQLTTNLQLFNNRSWESKFTTQYITKKGSKVNHYFVNYSHSALRLISDGYIKNKNSSDPLIYLKDYSNYGTYRSDLVSVSTNRNYQIKKGKINWEIETGLAHLNRREILANTQKKIIPELSVLVRAEKRLQKGFGVYFTTNYLNKAISLSEIQQILLPSQNISFQSKNIPLVNVPKLRLQFSVLQAKTSSNTIGLFYNFEQTFKNVVSQSYFGQLVNILRDSLIAKSAISNSISTSNTILVEPMKGKIHLSGSYSIRQFYISHNNTAFSKALNFYSNISLDLESRPTKKYYLYSANSISYQSNKLPKSITSRFTTSIYTLRNSLNQRYNFSDQLSLYFETNLYYFNFTSPERTWLVFLDADLQYKFRNKYGVNIKIENILNQKVFQIFNTSFLSQSISTIPLIPRNIVISFRVEL